MTWSMISNKNKLAQIEEDNSIDIINKTTTVLSKLEEEFKEEGGMEMDEDDSTDIISE
jgi:hypothetical protein